MLKIVKLNFHMTQHFMMHAVLCKKNNNGRTNDGVVGLYAFLLFSGGETKPVCMDTVCIM